MTNKFTKIVASNGSNIFILTCHQSNKCLDKRKVAIWTFHHASIFLEKCFRVSRTPLEMTRFHFILVHFPATHFTVILGKQLVENVNVCKIVREE